ncbi:MAG: cytochrome c-type biogenesis CcmF C-terminal domain-containing protein [Anaerolineae bacterium]
MLATLGSILLLGALLQALYAAGMSGIGAWRRNTRWVDNGATATRLTPLLAGLALGVLLSGFLGDHFTLRYVAEHSSRSLPLYLKVSAVWAGQEGSLLLWATLQTGLAALLARRSSLPQPMAPWVNAYLSLVGAFSLGLTLFLSNPFQPLATAMPDGLGMNPLLRHPGMVFHPVALYLGFVGLAAPAALALAALATGQVQEWIVIARRWTLAAWLFLGLGLLLGARWAYDVLGWGGYWAWDPVENAGLMPWLAATALLHGLVMQERTGRFRLWNVILATLSLALVLFGAFASRSGLIQSVHAFGRSSLGAYFLGGMAVVAAAALWTGWRRRQELREEPGDAALLSREGAFTLTLVLLVTITASVFVGSILPTLTEALGRGRYEAGPAWFDRVVGPQFAALVLLMGICPLLGGAVASIRRVRAAAPALLGGVVLITATLGALGFSRPLPLAGFFIVGLTGTAILFEFVRDVRRGVQVWGDLPATTRRLVAGNRRRYGGFLVHAGVVLIALGVIGTRAFAVERDTELITGQPFSIQGYTLVYEDISQAPAEDRLVTAATIAVYRGNQRLATLRPRVDHYYAQDQPVATPALRSTLQEDLYVVLAGWSETGQQATFHLVVNPLASFLWLGSLTFLLGGAVALWPVARPATDLVPARPRALHTGLVVGLGALFLGSASLAMWGGNLSLPTAARGRPAVGALAPTFAVDTLDGGHFALDDQRGRVTVVNFWAGWCEPCRDELPDLQRVYAAYQNRDVTLVGLLYRETREGALRAVESYGLSYPLGEDPGHAIARAYGITGIPETFVLDAQGRVAYTHIGPISAERLAHVLEALLASE